LFPLNIKKKRKKKQAAKTTHEIYLMLTGHGYFLPFPLVSVFFELKVLWDRLMIASLTTFRASFLLGINFGGDDNALP
jgi:hypothetical protein